MLPLNGLSDRVQEVGRLLLLLLLLLCDISQVVMTCHEDTQRSVFKCWIHFQERKMELSYYIRGRIKI